MPHCHKLEVILEKGLVESAPANQKAQSAQTLTRLKTEYYTLAQAFKAEEYATAHFGKWHLGPEPYSPLEQGFDLDISDNSRIAPLHDIRRMVINIP